jgi:drug/metabolite transporter (DMT)-like permease
VLAAVSRTSLRLGTRTWLHLAVLAALLNSVPFTLFAYGETHVSSILVGIINAATPLATLAVTLAAFREEPVDARRVAGLLIGFAGVLVVLGVWSGVPGGEAVGALACLAAICCYGVAYPYARRHLTGIGRPPLALAAGQVLLGTALLLPVLPLSWGGGGAVDGQVVAAMLALGVLGSGVAYILNFHIVEAAGATTASTVTYVIPLVAVVAGVAFLGESLTWYEPVGGLVVLLGVAVGSGRVPLPHRWLRPERRRRARARG